MFVDFVGKFTSSLLLRRYTWYRNGKYLMRFLATRKGSVGIFKPIRFSKGLDRIRIVLLQSGLKNGLGVGDPFDSFELLL